MAAAAVLSGRLRTAGDMVARCTVWYNVVKPHETLEGVSRTMAAGVSTIWSIADRAEMVAAAPKSGKRAYKARETIS